MKHASVTRAGRVQNASTAAGKSGEHPFMRRSRRFFVQFTDLFDTDS